jgi:Protein of unknown function (DUF3179)
MNHPRWRWVFYGGIALLIVFELARVWFIMPLPGSQQMRSIDFAYTLHTWRWPVRFAIAALIVAGAWSAWRSIGWRKVFMPAALAFAGLAAYGSNVTMAADRIFIAPKSISMQPVERNVVEMARLVVGIEVNGEARAYPVQFIGYHHQVRDSVAGTPVLVSFCTVCRTGRVFSPVIDGRAESFRLVGMDHFNAMFEDSTTKSWWRQANGEAIVGPRRGKRLAEIQSRQVMLAQWLALHPRSLIMQPDSALASRYARDFDYETGRSRRPLTGSDSASWRDKSWVVGITVSGASRAYDWNRLGREGVVNDTLGGQPIVLALASDRSSYFAFVRPDTAARFSVRNDSLVAGHNAWAFTGRGATGALQPIGASQEFWHSWRTFQPETSRY